MTARSGFGPGFSRVLDIVIATVVLIVTAPLMVAVAAAIRVSSPGPVIFRQERIGRSGETFTLYKFRTMRSDATDDAHREFVSALITAPDRTDGAAADSRDGSQYKLADDGRVTAVGHWLRRYSIDELPQFFNVLDGSMAVVGPRPGLGYEAELYGDLERRRLLVKPGITGLWQVSGRNRLSMRQMFELDARYVTERSVRLDLEILRRTPRELVRPSGAA
ncbi:MAG TPA: sugar transferase [Ilumatobacteraceae bacterium]|nr:sugar transferase [Ilumatobacteraceae bacterium]